MDPDYIEETKLKGVFIISRPSYGDERGFFRETFRKDNLDSRLEFPFDPVQANHSRSQKDSLRGIHFAPWHKLVTVTHGQVQQVVVDNSEDSETYGQHISLILGEGNWHSLFIPAGYGNAFLTLSDTADYVYLTTGYWAPGKETEIIYNDKGFGIKWQTDNPIVSEKDKANPSSILSAKIQ